VISCRELSQQFVFSVSKLGAGAWGCSVAQSKRKALPENKLRCDSSDGAGAGGCRHCLSTERGGLKYKRRSEVVVWAVGGNYCIRILYSAGSVFKSGLLDKNRSLNDLQWMDIEHCFSFTLRTNEDFANGTVGELRLGLKCSNARGYMLLLLHPFAK